MPRKKREKSSIGLYHVMLRGINKQEIFFHYEDFLRMMTILKDAPYLKDRITGKIISDNQCTIYAYCILHNHLHILIGEGERPLSETVKIIEDRYAMYYNRKYERIGHLFQGRFASEAINDDTYFRTVLRYIARNPVKAMESPTAEAYPYSSWNEFTRHKSNILSVLKPIAIQYVTDKFSLDELAAWIEEDNQDRCLDMDDFSRIKSDKEAWDILSDLTGYNNPEDFRTLDSETQIYYLLEAIDHGITLSQASRLGTLSRYVIERAQRKKFGESFKSGSDPDLKGTLENREVDALEELQGKVRRIKGQSKMIYHRLHRIVEFLNQHQGDDVKCAEVAEFIDVCNESARKALVLLSNENIVEIIGKGKSRSYRLR